ncbi:lysosomal alpha-mannosidase precursor-like protein [Euroglyphus maynei]|uniref:Alpha-mannosidase n=1 Tax=Euroglyphus maynei TaxID=6958 RepID=A0A1Y3BAN4_EURMA|nr:lysosomal alpha-mannosidase precursor-like protein [Euroglyphus maynei]
MDFKLFFFIVAISFQQCLSVVIKVENLPEQCDYSQCPKWNKNDINVHLVAHTHDDVGWLKTVEQYYYGLRNDIQRAGVQYILDTMIEELIRNKERRFIYVEIAFFWKWWQEQDEDQRMIVRELVRTGQLEFINGGWSMPDEAATHYNSLIDQSTWGLRQLNDTFGNCGHPKVTWQIDPFGHSREMANLYAQMGYDALFFARQDYQDREHRMANRTLEHVWQGSDDLGIVGDIFTGMMFSGYGPIEFNWDITNGPEDAVVDNPDSEEYNVPDKIRRFVEKAKYFGNFYATNHFMFPMGTDFQYTDAHTWFKNLDKLIKAVNGAGQGVRAFYSTPSCYAHALYESNRTWTTKTDDFFPYASDEHAYWTGYFTSRPAIKRMERMGNNLLQACKQLDVLADNNGRYEMNITRMREAMGVMQHHDAVTGTEKQHVAFNYAKMLDAAMTQCRHVINESYRKLFPSQTEQHQFCPYLNISSCPATEMGESRMIHLYNPLGHRLVNRTIRLPVKDGYYYQIRNQYGNTIPSVLVPIPEFVRKIPGRISVANKELVFRVPIMESLGITTMYMDVTEKKQPYSAVEIEGEKFNGNEGIRIQMQDGLIVEFDSNGTISTMIRNDQSISISNEFRFYRGADIGRHSGAYIFRPSEQKTFPVNRKKMEATLYIDRKFGIVQQVHQQFDSYVGQIIRMDEKTDYVEFDFVVGPIPVNDKIGKEIITRYSTNLENDETFYTDANGRQMLRRRWNYRPSWKYEIQEPVSGNYYPVNSRIAIRDVGKSLQMTIMTDRSQGGSLSPEQINGSIDLMVHRRLLHDDYFGVGEPLNEPGVDGHGLVIRGRHLLLLDQVEQAAVKHRPLAQEMFMEPIISFTPFQSSTIMNNRNYMGLKKQLPPNVHLLTLEQWHSKRYLLRLEHFYQRFEHPEMSKPVTVSLRHLFNSFEIIAVEELTLGANQPISTLKNRLHYRYIRPLDDERQQQSMSIESDPIIVGENFDIQLVPMQIRTFLIDIKRN